MKSKTNLCFLYVILAAALWGIAGIFVRTLSAASIFGMQIVLGRAFFSSLTLGAIILFKDKQLFKIKLKDLWLFACGGIFSIVLFNYSYYTTMELTGSLAIAAVLLYTAPFFVCIISIFLFGEKLRLNTVTACIVAFLGCCMVSGLFDSSHRISGKALFFGLMTGFGYALYTIFGELLVRRNYSTLTITFYVFSAAALGSMPFVNIGKTVSLLSDNITAFVTIFLMALLNTVIPYLLYTAGLKVISPSVAPIIATLEPVVAAIVGLCCFSEKISFWGYWGMFSILSSVVILNLKSEKKLKLKANAKINLGLDISGKRDDGYHLIDTIMQSVDLYDEIEVSLSNELSVECNLADLDEKNNIAYKAAKLFFEQTGKKGGAKIKISKNIPAAAGIGGGSADAAAVLLALDKLYNTKLSETKLCELALKLGADVPFFINGGTQRSEGIGEVLTPLKKLDSGYFLLIKQATKPSTGEMYRRLDSEEHPHPDILSVITAIENGDLKLLAESLDNSFIAVNEPFALKERLLSAGALAVSLSGSGPTNFAVFETEEKAKEIYNILKGENLECYLTKPADCAVSFE